MGEESKLGTGHIQRRRSLKGAWADGVAFSLVAFKGRRRQGEKGLGLREVGLWSEGAC